VMSAAETVVGCGTRPRRKVVAEKGVPVGGMPSRRAERVPAEGSSAPAPMSAALVPARAAATAASG
jgi:hypothetical protein